MSWLPDYAELHCLSCFSFQRGASHPQELVARAAQLVQGGGVRGGHSAALRARTYGAAATRMREIDRAEAEKKRRLEADTIDSDTLQTNR